MTNCKKEVTSMIMQKIRDITHKNELKKDIGQSYVHIPINVFIRLPFILKFFAC